MAVGAVIVAIVVVALVRGEVAPRGRPPAGFFARLGWSLLPTRYGDLRDGNAAAAYLVWATLLAYGLSVLVFATAVPSELRVLGTLWARVPSFAVHDGFISVGGPIPHNYGTATVPIIVDTTGQTSPAVLAAAPAGILVTSRVIYMKRSRLQTDTYDLSTLNITIDKAGVAALVRRWIWPALAAGVLGGAVVVLVASFLRALAVALAVALVLRATGRRPALPRAWSASAHAWTLPMLVGPLHAPLGLPAWPFWVTATGLAIAGGLVGPRGGATVADAGDLGGEPTG